MFVAVLILELLLYAYMQYSLLVFLVWLDYLAVQEIVLATFHGCAVSGIPVTTFAVLDERSTSQLVELASSCKRGISHLF